MQPAAAVLSRFQPAYRRSGAPRGARGRPAGPRLAARPPPRTAARSAPPPPARRPRLGSGPSTPERCAPRGHEAAAPAPASSGATSAPRPGLFQSFLPAADPPQERAMETGRPLAAPATPPRGGWGNRARSSVRSGLGDSPGAARLATPRRRAWQPSPDRGPRAGLPRPPGQRVAAAAGGLHGQRIPGSLLPHRGRAGREEGRGGGGGGGGGARLGAAGRVPQTLVCKAQPRRARGARSGSASSQPGGRRPSPSQPGSSSRSSFSPAEPCTGPAGSPPQAPRAGQAPSPPLPGGKCWAPRRHRSRTARVGARWPGRALARRLGPPPPGFSSGLFPAAATASARARTHTHSHIHAATRKALLAAPGDLRNPRGEVTLPGPDPARPLPPPSGARGRLAGSSAAAREWAGVPGDGMGRGGTGQA